jgi:MFS family permease
MGQSHNTIIFTLLFSVVWAAGGMQLATTQILVALLVKHEQRGRAFGLLMTAGPLGMLIGGLLAGQIVDTWGFDALFLVCSGIYGLALLVSRAVVAAPEPGAVASARTGGFIIASPVFLALMAASILGQTANFTINIARPLAMDALHFDAFAITSTVTVSGIVTVALPFIAGWLSDRFGRKPLFISAYLLAAAGASLFIVAAMLWQFWVAQALVAVLGSSMAIGAAIVSDIVPPTRVDVAVARFSATPWIGAVIGSTTAGVAVEQLGSQATFSMAAGLIIIAIIIALSVRIARYVEPAERLATAGSD